MRRTSTHRSLVLLGCLLLTSTAAAASKSRPSRFWKVQDPAWLDQAFALGHDLLHRRLVSKETDALLESLDQSLSDLSLDRLYQRLGSGPGQHFLRLEGRWGPDGYRIDTAPPGTAASAASFGAFDALIVIEPDELPEVRGEGFALGIELTLHVGTLSWQQGAGIFAGLLQDFERALEHPVQDPLRRDIHDLHPRLADEVDFQIGAELRRLFPATIEHLDQLLDARDLARPDAAGMHMRFELGLRDEIFSARYPRLARWVDRLGGVLELQTRLRIGSGPLLIESQLLTRDPCVIAEARSSGGALLPLRETSLPDRLEFDRPGQHEFLADSRIVFRYRGMHSVFGPVLLPLHWVADDSRSSLDGLLLDKPPAAVQGRFLHLVPKSVVDFFVPRSIDAVTEEFVTVLSGESTGWRFELLFEPVSPAPETKPPLQHRILLRAHGHLLDNALLRMGLRMAGRRLRLKDSAREELEALLQEILHRAEADYLQAFGQLDQPAEPEADKRHGGL